MKFKHHLLGDLIRVKHGFAFKSEYFSFESGEKIVLTPGNFYEEGGFKLRPNKDRYYSGDYPHDFLLKKNDLIIAMTEQTYGLLGSPALIPENNKYLHNQRLGKFELLRNNQVSVFFLYYLFHIKGLRDEISNTASGTKIRHTAPERISKIKIPLPPLPIQKKIAAVLSAYDDLIENNNRRIALLEKMAEELYREWFVRLRFPGHDNVKIIKGIPEGWEVGIIGNLFNVKSGYAFKSDDLGDMGHPIIKITNIQNGFIDKVDVQRFSGNIHKRIAQFELMDGDFLIAMTGAQVGKTGLFMMSKERFFLNQRVGKFFHRLINDNNIIFIKIFCQTNYFKSQIENYAIGAAQPNISGAQIESIKILIPTENLLKRFSLLTKPFLQKIFSLKKQNENLILFRDCLLSRLMSGSIDTENLDIRFPKSMMEEEGHG